LKDAVMIDVFGCLGHPRPRKRNEFCWIQVDRVVSVIVDRTVFCAYRLAGHIGNERDRENE
jgi:hypothetical protein